jgi:hypothetical protein
MKQSLATQKRKKLENKIAKVFESDIKSLPSELREILVDDLVTAFESRLYALSRAQSNIGIGVIEGEVQIETQQA